MKLEEITLRRSSSSCRSSRRILPSAHHHHHHARSPSSSAAGTTSPDAVNSSLSRRDQINGSSSSSSSSSLSLSRLSKTRSNLISFLRSLLSIVSFPATLSVPTCRWLALPVPLSPSAGAAPSLGRKVTGTLFGHRKGHVTFSVQDNPRADPVLLIELATSTSALVKEMSSGLVRIALECEKPPAPPSHDPSAASRGRRGVKLFNEPVWTMYLNGRKCGYAMSRACSEFDCHVLNTVHSVSVGAGVIPLVEDRKIGGGGGSEGELLYMRAKFERVVGSRDSEAFYMLNPDGNGGPELSIFLLRL